jgi:hypothetical protein
MLLLSRHLSEGTKENHVNPRFEQKILRKDCKLKSPERRKREWRPRNRTFIIISIISPLLTEGFSQYGLGTQAECRNKHVSNKLRLVYWEASPCRRRQVINLNSCPPEGPQLCHRNQSLNNRGWCEGCVNHSLGL